MWRLSGLDFVVNTIDQDLTSSLLSSVSSSWSRSVFLTEKFATSKYKNSHNWLWLSDCLARLWEILLLCRTEKTVQLSAGAWLVGGGLPGLLCLLVHFSSNLYQDCSRSQPGLWVVTIYININHPLPLPALPHLPVSSLIIAWSDPESVPDKGCHQSPHWS